MSQPILRSRRNAFSITGELVGKQVDMEAKGAAGDENLRAMSVTPEVGHEISVKNLLSRFSITEDSNEPAPPPKPSGSALTDAQINAFKEVFDLFDSNGGGTIDADELDLALQSVGITLSGDDLSGVLETMDKDGNGEIDFTEFLNLMTNTEKFLESCECKSDGIMSEEKRRREIMLFEALTQFMKNSALHSMEEIVGFFSSKYKRSQAPHVVGHYAAGARLIGLTEKQIQQHMERMRETNANSNSPYAQPLYNLNHSSGRIKRPSVASAKLDKGAVVKRGKIRLRFHIDNKKTCPENEDKTPECPVRGVKSASDITSPTSGEGSVSKKPRQILVKKHGWVREKPKPLLVRLPTVHVKPRKPSAAGERLKGTLTFDDLPAIRREVDKVKECYYKKVRSKKAQEAEQHWKSLHTDDITSNVLKRRFGRIFRAYTAVT